MMRLSWCAVGWGVPWLVVAACLGVTVLGGCTASEGYKGLQTKRSREAEPESRMRQDRPPTQKTLFTMAGILATQGKDRRCEFVLRRCIQEYPRFAPAYNSLAELLMRQGRANEAVDVLSAAIGVQPDNPVLLNNLGMCLMVCREYEAALEQFTHAAGLRPEMGKYRANMATVLGLLGRHEESQSLLVQILSDEDASHNSRLLQEASKKVAAPLGPSQG